MIKLITFAKGKRNISITNLGVIVVLFDLNDVLLSVSRYLSRSQVMCYKM
jgi:hypothetical protein